MISKEEVSKLSKIITANNSFIITSHHNPDGDALGSEIAMAEYLKSLGKTVHIINNSETPGNYQFLDEDYEIIVYEKRKHQQLIDDVDVYLILDISDWGRLRELGEIIKDSSATKICIDHHHVDYKFADIDIIYEQASSTGELLFEFLQAVNFQFDQRTATALYTCILTDTGSFRFSNTTSKTHEVASILLKTGIKTKEIYSLIYEQNSRSKMALMGETLYNLKYECDGKLAWFILTKEMFEKHQASNWDTEGFPELPRTIEGVEVSLMFTELNSQKVKISLRSKGKIIINTIAQKSGGGGHSFAAGSVIEKSLEDVVPLILDEVKKVICDEVE